MVDPADAPPCDGRLSVSIDGGTATDLGTAIETSDLAVGLHDVSVSCDGAVVRSRTVQVVQPQQTTGGSPTTSTGTVVLSLLFVMFTLRVATGAPPPKPNEGSTS